MFLDIAPFSLTMVVMLFMDYVLFWNDRYQSPIPVDQVKQLAEYDDERGEAAFFFSS